VSARDDTLRALRAAAPAEEPLPDVGRINAVRYPDLRERFAQSVVEVGGRCIHVEGALEDALMSIPEYAAARRVVSLVPGVAKANVDLAAVTDPHRATAERSDVAPTMTNPYSRATAHSVLGKDGLRGGSLDDVRALATVQKRLVFRRPMLASAEFIPHLGLSTPFVAEILVSAPPA